MSSSKLFDPNLWEQYVKELETKRELLDKFLSNPTEDNLVELVKNLYSYNIVKNKKWFVWNRFLLKGSKSPEDVARDFMALFDENTPIEKRWKKKIPGMRAPTKSEILYIYNPEKYPLINRASLQALTSGFEVLKYLELPENIINAVQDLEQTGVDNILDRMDKNVDLYKKYLDVFSTIAEKIEPLRKRIESLTGLKLPKYFFLDIILFKISEKELSWDDVINALEELGVKVEGVSVEEPGRPSMVWSISTLGRPSDGRFIVLAHLMAGKNVLLVGPPGSGKTSLLKDLLEELEITYSLVTGNPEWTPFDTIGGVIPGRNVEEELVKKGFIFKTIEESIEALKNGRLHWFILDEINRANVDLAFGKFFTLLDPTHREKEKLEIYGHEGVKASVAVPFSFRVLATMNNYDRALLFKLGYALTRRFAVINHYYLENLSTYCKDYASKASDENIKNELIGYFKDRQKKENKDKLRIDFKKIRDDLVKCREDIPHDCITPVDFANKIRNNDKWDEEVYSVKVKVSKSEKGSDSEEEVELRLDKILLGLVGEINEKLKEYSDCEICPVQITPGLVADALKYLAIGLYAYKQGYTAELKYLEDVVKKLIEEKKLSEKEQATVRTLAYTLLLLDTAFSTYILPQLDILADYANREKLYRGRAGTTSERGKKSIVDILEIIRNEILGKAELVYSAELVGKLANGYHVF